MSTRANAYFADNVLDVRVDYFHPEDGAEVTIARHGCWAHVEVPDADVVKLIKHLLMPYEEGGRLTIADSEKLHEVLSKLDKPADA